MSQNSHYIASLCRQLSEQGQPISVAMLRSKADRPLSIPEVVSILKRWKQNPEQFNVTSDEKESTRPVDTLSLEQRVDALEKQLAILQSKLEKLSID